MLVCGTDFRNFDVFLRRYFPRGGGHCIIDIKPVVSLNATEICDFGEVDSFFGWSFVAGTLPIKVSYENRLGWVDRNFNRLPTDGKRVCRRCHS